MQSRSTLQLEDKTLSFSFYVTREEVLQSQRACKSTNGLHTDSAMAHAIGLKDIVMPATMILENAQSQLCEYVLRQNHCVLIAVGADDIKLRNFAYPAESIAIKATLFEERKQFVKVRFFCLQDGRSCFSGVSTFLIQTLPEK